MIDSPARRTISNMAMTATARSIRESPRPSEARGALEAGFSFGEEVLVGDSAMSLV
jgi:hypothetical protein